MPSELQQDTLHIAQVCSPKMSSAEPSRIHLLYFAAVAELIGKRTEERTLPNKDISVSELLSDLEQEYGEMAEPALRVAVNEEFVDKDYLLKGGDTVALIPPVSGG